MKEVKELRELSDDDLRAKIEEYKTELRKVRTDIGKGGSVQNPARARLIRKSIARAYTILAERRLKKNVK
ncbi:MAG: 50S ribosomal protein L29 [Candidatus Caldarchaeum sp.]|nr:50S ribosomal protein L29 [Candidatus Caldarchaeum sp.]